MILSNEILFICVWDDVQNELKFIKWIISKFLMNQFQCWKFSSNDQDQKTMESTQKISDPSNMKNDSYKGKTWIIKLLVELIPIGMLVDSNKQK